MNLNVFPVFTHCPSNGYLELRGLHPISSYVPWRVVNFLPKSLSFKPYLSQYCLKSKEDFDCTEPSDAFATTSNLNVALSEA